MFPISSKAEIQQTGCTTQLWPASFGEKKLLKKKTPWLQLASDSYQLVHGLNFPFLCLHMIMKNAAISTKRENKGRRNEIG